MKKVSPGSANRKLRWILVAAIVTPIAILAFLIIQFRSAFLVSTPGQPRKDVVRGQAQSETRLNIDGETNVGNVWLDAKLKSVDSVEVIGADLLMYILTTENQVFSGGNPDHHILFVYIRQTEIYIDGFIVVVNGHEYELTRQPKNLANKFINKEADPDDARMGYRKWSNKWFPITRSAFEESLEGPPTSAPGVATPAEGQEYASHAAPLPYVIGPNEVVSWPAADPSEVIVTSTVDLVDAPNSD